MASNGTAPSIRLDALSSDSAFGAGGVGALDVYTGSAPVELAPIACKRAASTSERSSRAGIRSTQTPAGEPRGTTGGNMIVGWAATGAGGGQGISATYVGGLTPTAPFNGLHMLSDSVGWAVGASGLIYSKSGSGTDWAKQPTTTTQALNAVWAVSPTTAYAVGVGSTILRTDDAGATWRAFGAAPATGQTLNAVHCLADESTCWVVGAGGLAWRYDAGTNTWVAFNYGKGTNL